MNELHNSCRSINLNGNIFSFPASLELRATQPESARDQGTRITQLCGFLALTSLRVCVRVHARLRVLSDMVYSNPS